MRYVKMTNKGSDRVLETSPGIADPGARFSKSDKIIGFGKLLLFISKIEATVVLNMIKTIG